MRKPRASPFPDLRPPAVAAAARQAPRQALDAGLRLQRAQPHRPHHRLHLQRGRSFDLRQQERHRHRAALQRPVRSAAADWSFYPVGTTFRIKGLPYLYVVDDYGSALTGTGTIDIYKPTKEIMNLWGRRNVELTIVQWGSFTRSAELLSKRTSFDHCRKMLANIVRQRPDLASVAVR
jgi:hypothetical protein